MLPLQSSYTTGQTAVAVAVLIGILAFAAVARARLRYRGLDEPAREHVQAVLGHQVTTDPASERLEQALACSDADAVRDAVRTLVQRAKDADRGGSVRPARAALCEAWRDATDQLPDRTRTLGRLAVLVVLFAPVAASADTLQALLASDPNTDPGTLVDLLTGNGTALLATARDTVALFPFAGLVWALGFTAVILTTEWLFANWWLVAAALGASAVGLWRLDDDLDTGGGPYVPLSERALNLLGTLALIWLLGTAPAVVGRAVGFGGVGSGLGMLAALVASGLIGYRRTRRYLRRVTLVPADEPFDPAALGYRAARSASGVLIVVAVPLVALWAGVAVVSGNFLTLAAAVASADPVVQVGVLLMTVAFGAGLSLLVRDAWPDVRERLLEAAVRRRVRAALWAQGMPIFTGAMIYAGLTQFTSLPVAAGLAILGMVVLRGAASLLTRARYSASLRESATPDRGQDPYIEVWVAEDADGRTQYLGRVSGHDIAHTDWRAFVDRMTDAAVAVAEDGEGKPSLEAEYYTRLVEAGIVDIDEVRVALREEIEKVAFNALRDDDGDRRAVRREWFDAQLDEYPDDIVDDALGWHADRGTIHMTSDTVELRSDPRAVSRTVSRGPQQVTMS